MYAALLCAFFAALDPTPDLPPLALANALPPHKYCVHAYALGSDVSAAFRQKSYQLEADGFFVESWSYWGLQERISERMQLWHEARTATNPKASEQDRRAALAWLVDRLGIRAVLSGEIPYVLPLED